MTIGLGIAKTNFNPTAVKIDYLTKQFLRFGGLATAAVSASAVLYSEIYNTITNQNINENFLSACTIIAGAGLFSWLYSGNIHVFRTSDGKNASLDDILNC